MRFAPLKESSLGVKDLAANFDRRMQRRVVISGHGSYRDADPQIVVPQGKTLYFYVLHGTGLDDAVGQAVEGFDAGVPPMLSKPSRVGISSTTTS